MYSIMRATSFSVFNCKVFLPSLNKVIYLFIYLLKKKYEKPSKWRKLKEEFILEDKQVSEAFMMPLRVANEPYLRSFQYKVLNFIYK